MIVETIAIGLTVGMYYLYKSSKIPKIPKINLSKANFEGAFDHEVDNSQKQTTFNVLEIPIGYYVYEDDSFFVQGVTYKKKNCIDWARGEDHSIRFKREPNNKHDDNAIAIYGESTNGIFHLGYIASDIAYELVDEKLDDKIIARLLNVEIKMHLSLSMKYLLKRSREALC